MGQSPSPYEPGAYGTASRSPAASPYNAVEPYTGTPPAYAAPGSPSPGTAYHLPTPPAYGRPGPYGPGGVPYVQPYVLVAPPSPEEVAERGRRTTRGLGLGAVVTGTVSVVIQDLTVLGMVLMAVTGGSGSRGATFATGMFIVLSILVVPPAVFLAWAVSFGLALTACVRAAGAGRQPAHWAGAGGLMGGLLTVSVLQGVPAVMIIFTIGLYEDSRSSGDAMLAATAVAGIVLLVVHIVLIARIRALGTGTGPQVPYT